MAPIRTFAGLALIGTALAGCSSYTNGLSTHHNPSLYSVNQPVVQRTDFVFDVASQGGGVPSSELSRLDAWFASLNLGYGDRVSIDDAGGYAGGARDDVGRVAGRYGLLVSDGAPVTAGQVPPGSLRVVVSRSTAAVPGCPVWDEQQIGARITTSPNFGCAMNSNLAAMVADPNDLVLGQAGSASVDAATSTKAIKTYRERRPTGAENLKAEATRGGE